MPQDANAIRSILSLAPVVPVIILDDVAQPVPGRSARSRRLAGAGSDAAHAQCAQGDGRNGQGDRRHRRLGHGAQWRPHEVVGGCRLPLHGVVARRLAAAARCGDDVAIPLLPGIGTPTEAMAAAERGYSFLKFFPAEALGGAPVLKAFASPLPDITFCPTGGIDVAKARTYLALPNVICVGGSWIMPQDALASGDFARIEALAREASALKA